MIGKDSNIVQFLSHLGPYLLRRVLVFIPTILFISLLAFIISVNAPGDPIEKLVNTVDQGGAGKSNNSSNDATKAAMRKKLGLDKPLFYFGLGTLADCDTLYRVSNKQEREALSDLTREVGDWGLVSDFHQLVYESIDRLKENVPDSVLSKEEVEVKAQLTFNLEGLKSVSKLSDIVSKLADSDSLLIKLQHGYEIDSIKSVAKKLANTGLGWKKYVPKLFVHGMDNQYHLWFAGDIGLAKKRDTIRLEKNDNGIYEFLEFKIAKGEDEQFYLQKEISGEIDTLDVYSSMEDFEYDSKGRSIEVEENDEGGFFVIVDTGRKGIIRGDFGISYLDSMHISDKIGKKVSVSFWLIFFSIILSYIVSVPIGIYAAYKKDSNFDRGSSIVLFVLYSMPSFFVAVVLMRTFANPDVLLWFPESGLFDPSIYQEDWSFWKKVSHQAPYYVIPLVTYTYSSFAFLSRIMRVGMVDALGRDYVRTARAKGLSEKIVVLKHVLRNSLIPIITVFSNVFPAAVGGSVIIESIFSIDGMGKAGFEAIQNLDYPMIIAVFTISGALTVIGYLVADVLYAIVDPRISFKK